MPGLALAIRCNCRVKKWSTWGFSALVDDGKTMEHNGKAYPLHTGAVIWIRAHDMP